MPRKRKLQQMRVHGFLSARTCSSRCELVTALRITQEISARVEAAVLSRTGLDLRVMTRATTLRTARKLIVPRLASAYSGLLIAAKGPMNFSHSAPILGNQQNAVHM